MDPEGTVSSVALGNGWYYRIDRANTNTKTQRHIHVWKGKKSYFQNDDGSPHDGSTGAPPKKIRKQLKEKGVWDWDAKSEAYKKATSTSNSSAVLDAVTALGAVYIIYRLIRMLPSLFPPLWWTAPVNVVTP